MPEQKKNYKNCVHYWIIDAANGSTSFGRCRYCGLVKAFSNNWENPYDKQNIPEAVAAGHHDQGDE